MYERVENFTRMLESTQKSKRTFFLQWKTTLSEVKNSLGRCNNRLDLAKHRICELLDISIENNQTEAQRLEVEMKRTQECNTQMF